MRKTKPIEKTLSYEEALAKCGDIRIWHSPGEWNAAFDELLWFVSGKTPRKALSELLKEFEKDLK